MNDSTPADLPLTHIRDWTLRDGQWEATEASPLPFADDKRRSWSVATPFTLVVLTLLSAMVVLVTR
ncbi:hypothetical protein QLQ12_37590 [Actinoplanes sp. NEAU-A12]|uniref:Uncharacterized protein n=1 Tax=Actinoplanes sandaracinus TaxID=3045177 RepID=A0ABT6WX56_9ACTN|nr:hypothetical protein [Actinoplanes sandaracinus]MDI6104322.1 hypothetical protein [Actinoplanes sandaracinus]